jgi:hypothetical protein
MNVQFLSNVIKSREKMNKNVLAGGWVAEGYGCIMNVQVSLKGNNNIVIIL